MNDVPVIILIFLLFIFNIACVISALLNAYLFSIVYFLKGRKNVYGKGYLYYFSIYAIFSLTFVCLSLMSFFRHNLNLMICISVLCSILFGAFLMRIFFDEDVILGDFILSILFFIFGIPALIGGLYIITLPLGPFFVSFR